MGGLFSHPLPVHIVALPPGKTFSDDDGEARAGGRLKGALKKRKAVGVACLVARWYGGVNIGKVGRCAARLLSVPDQVYVHGVGCSN